MEAGKASRPVDYDCVVSDGLYEEDQLFAVWEAEDARRLVARLQRALAEGYGLESAVGCG